MFLFVVRSIPHPRRRTVGDDVQEENVPLRGVPPWGLYPLVVMSDGVTHMSFLRESNVFTRLSMQYDTTSNENNES